MRVKHEDAAEPPPQPGHGEPPKGRSLRLKTRSTTKPPPSQPPPSAPPTPASALSSESACGDVCVTLTRTRHERDAEARRHAMDLEALDEGPATKAATVRSGPPAPSVKSKAFAFGG